MPPVTLPPIWLTSDFQALELPGVNLPFATLVNKAQDAVQGFLAPVRDAATKSVDINNRLKQWYADEQANKPVNELQELSDAIDGYLQDVWETGVHLYMPLPDFGGLTYLKTSLVRALNDPIDPNVPLFEDEMYVGGAVVVLSGGRLQVLVACGALLTLLGGDGTVIEEGIRRLFTESSPIAELADEFHDLLKVPQELWTREQKEIQQWWEGSPIKKVLSGEVFPGELFKQVQQAIAPVQITFEPAEAPYGSHFTFSIQTDFIHEIAPGVGVKLGALPLVNPDRRVPSKLEWDITPEMSARIGTAGQPVAVGLTDVLNPDVVIKPLGNFTWNRPSPTNLSELLPVKPAFNTWQKYSAGDAVNALIPGATNVVKDAVKGIEAIAQIASIPDMLKGGAQDFMHLALESASDIAAGTLTEAADFTDGIDDAVGETLDEFGKLSAATLLLPPAKGGVHQLQWALNQGLREGAPGAPSVTEDQVSLALFVVAGSVDYDALSAQLRKAGSVLGIKELAYWGITPPAPGSEPLPPGGAPIPPRPPAANTALTGAATNLIAEDLTVTFVRSAEWFNQKLEVVKKPDVTASSYDLVKGRLEGGMLSRAFKLVDATWAPNLGTGVPLRIFIEGERLGGTDAYVQSFRSPTLKQELHLWAKTFAGDEAVAGRILARELAHLAFSRTKLPQWFVEGASEFTVGGNDLVKAQLVGRSHQELLALIFKDKDADPEDKYLAAWYMAVRYLDSRLRTAFPTGLRGAAAAHLFGASPSFTGLLAAAGYASEDVFLGDLKGTNGIAWVQANMSSARLDEPDLGSATGADYGGPVQTVSTILPTADPGDPTPWVEEFAPREAVVLTTTTLTPPREPSFTVNVKGLVNGDYVAKVTDTVSGSTSTAEFSIARRKA